MLRGKTHTLKLGAKSYPSIKTARNLTIVGNFINLIKNVYSKHRTNITFIVIILEVFHSNSEKRQGHLIFPPLFRDIIVAKGKKCR